MNQQLIEKALQRFRAARHADSNAVAPLVNEGLAYLYLNKVAEAETDLNAATALDPHSVRAWYGLGVAEYTGGDSDAALVAFKHASALDPQDADTHYFLGAIYANQKNYDGAITEFNRALELNPLHASAQFGLARALQREGKTDDARIHVKRFQDITTKKIGILLSASYGSQGHYATAEDMLGAPTRPGPMLPITFVAATAADTAAPSPAGPEIRGGGVCVLDIAGNGSHDLVATAPHDGLHAFHVAPDGHAATALAHNNRSFRSRRRRVLRRR